MNDIYFAASSFRSRLLREACCVVGGKVVIRASAWIPFWE
jgi:hypothetical protein